MMLIKSLKHQVMRYGQIPVNKVHVLADNGITLCKRLLLSENMMFEGEWKDVDCDVCISKKAKKDRIAKEAAKRAQKNKQVLPEEREFIDEIPWSESDTELGLRMARQGGRAE